MAHTTFLFSSLIDVYSIYAAVSIVIRGKVPNLDFNYVIPGDI